MQRAVLPGANLIFKKKWGLPMPANIVVGTQWGDEGKGKIIELSLQEPM